MKTPEEVAREVLDMLKLSPAEQAEADAEEKVVKRAAEITWELIRQYPTISPNIVGTIACCVFNLAEVRTCLHDEPIEATVSLFLRMIAKHGVNLAEPQ